MVKLNCVTFMTIYEVVCVVAYSWIVLYFYLLFNTEKFSHKIRDHQINKKKKDSGYQS